MVVRGEACRLGRVELKEERDLARDVAPERAGEGVGERLRGLEAGGGVVVRARCAGGGLSEEELGNSKTLRPRFACRRVEPCKSV